MRGRMRNWIVALAASLCILGSTPQGNAASGPEIEASVRAQKIRERSLKGLLWIEPASTLGDPDGMMWRLLTPGAVYEYWRQPRFEELGNAARFSLDENFRGKVYAEMSQIVLENFPWIPILQANDNYGLQRYVEWKPYSNQQIELRAFNFRFRQA